MTDRRFGPEKNQSHLFHAVFVMQPARGKRGKAGQTEATRCSLVFSWESGTFTECPVRCFLRICHSFGVPRNARCVLAGIAYHVTQRGTDRQGKAGQGQSEGQSGTD